MTPRLFFVSLVVVSSLAICPVGAVPPEDPAARKIYDHNYKWLLPQHNSFIAANIRGESDDQYPERRQAALDILRSKRDLTTVPEIMDELRRGSFLSAEICDLLAEWRATKALPLLKEVSADPKRPQEVRTHAEKAVWVLKKPGEASTLPPGTSAGPY